MAKRESYVEKSIEILIRTGDFENIRVGAKIGETIDWADAAEREKKLDAVREDLKKQVARDVNDVLVSFELASKSNIKSGSPLRSIPSTGLDVAEEDDEFEL